MCYHIIIGRRRTRRRWGCEISQGIGCSLGCRTKNGQYIAQKCRGWLPCSLLRPLICPAPLHCAFRFLGRGILAHKSLRILNHSELGQVALHAAGLPDVFEKYVRFHCLLDLLSSEPADFSANSEKRIPKSEDSCHHRHNQAKKTIHACSLTLSRLSLPKGTHLRR